MTIDGSDLLHNDIAIHAHDSAPNVIDRSKNTIVVPLAQDEVLVLIQDLAGSAWAGGTHLVIETERCTYPRTVEE